MPASPNQKDQQSGPLSAEERRYIAAKVDTMFYHDIAETLKRNPETIRKYIKKNLGKVLKKSENVKKIGNTDIKSTVMWKELVKQFTEDELSTFIFHWNRILLQFKDDVFPTEEIQLIDMIKLEILMNRALEGEQTSRGKMLEYEQQIADERKLGLEKDEDKINLLEEQVLLCKAAFESIHSEYTDLLQKKSSILKDLKSTRADRIKRLDDSRQSFLGWITQLIDNNELRRQMGIYLEKMRIAIDVEEARLSQPIEFADKTTDLPILNAESLAKLEEEIIEEKEEDNE